MATVPSLVLSRPRQLSVGVLAALLAILATIAVVSALATMLLRKELDYGEPIVYGDAARLLQGEALYQPIDRQPFTVAAYTPLYYWVAAGLRIVVGPGFAPGRALSLVAGIVSAILLGYIAAVQTRTRWAGVFAASMFLALAFPGSYASWLALYRVDLLGVALSVGTIVVLSQGTTRLHLTVAALLAGLAVLTKQTFFAAILAGTLWLTTVRLRKASLFACVALLTILLVAALLQWSTSGAFFANTVLANANPISRETAAYQFQQLRGIEGVPALLALLFILYTRAWTSQSLRLIVIYWLASLISVAAIVKIGANHNYWIEFAGATAVLATLCVWTSLHAIRRPPLSVLSMVPIWLLAAHLGALVPARLIAPPRADLSPPEWTLHADEIARRFVLDREVGDLDSLLRQEPGEILAEPLDAVVRVDRPILLEPFLYSILENDGLWDSRPLVADICSGKVSLLIIGYPIDADLYPVGLPAYPMWPRTVMSALRASMVLESHEAGRSWLYRPRASLKPGAGGTCGQ